MANKPTPRIAKANAIAIVKDDGKHAVLRLTIVDDKVTSVEQIDRSYHRDLADDAARKAVRKL